jgi:outer membrane protein TolC
MSAYKTTARWIAVWLLVSAANSPCTISAQELDSTSPFFSPDQPLRLEEVIHYARDRHPALQAAQERQRALQQKPAQAGAYDDPMTSWESWNTPDNLRVDRADNNIFRITQKLPFPGKLQLKSVIAAADTHRQDAERQALALEIASQVKKAYYELWQGQQNLQVYTREKDLVAQAVVLVTQRYAHGQASQAEALRVQLELTKLNTRLATETIQLNTLQAQLNVLLDRPLNAPLGILQAPPPPFVPPTLLDLETQQASNRPEIKAQTITVEQAGTTVALARMASLPDFEFALGRFVNFGRADGFGFTISATIPLAFREKYEAAVTEANANLQAARHELRHQQNVFRFELAQALTAAERARTEVFALLSTQIPQAEQAVSTALIGYQNGTTDFLSLIESLRLIEAAHLERLVAAVNFEKAWADLERAVGQPLPRGAR